MEVVATLQDRKTRRSPDEPERAAPGESKEAHGLRKGCRQNGFEPKCMESNEIIWNVIYSRQRTGIMLVLCLPSLSHVPASGSEKDHGVRVVAA